MIYRCRDMIYGIEPLEPTTIVAGWSHPGAEENLTPYCERLRCPVLSLPAIGCLAHRPLHTKCRPFICHRQRGGALATSFARSVGIATSCYSGDLWRKRQRSNKKHHPIGWCFLLSLLYEKELGENRGFSLNLYKTANKLPYHFKQHKSNCNKHN